MPTMDRDVPTITGLANTLSVIKATKVVPMPTATKLLINKKMAEIYARNWLGANICMAVVEIGIGKEAKNIAGTNNTTDNTKLSV